MNARVDHKANRTPKRLLKIPSEADHSEGFEQSVLVSSFNMPHIDALTKELFRPCLPLTDWPVVAETARYGLVNAHLSEYRHTAKAAAEQVLTETVFGYIVVNT